MQLDGSNMIEQTMAASRSGRLVRAVATRKAIPDGVEQVIWCGAAASYPFPSAPVELEVISSDAKDTHTTGDGARVVRLTLLNASFDPVVLDVDLDGVNAVTVPGGAIFRRILRTEVVSAGADEVNAGIINVRVAGGGDILAHVNAGKSLSICPVTTVPRGFRLHITGGFVSLGAISGSKTVGDAFIYKRERADASDSVRARLLELPGVDGFAPVGDGKVLGYVPEKTDLWATGAGNGGVADITVEITGILERVRPA